MEVGVAMSGNADYSSGELRLTAGFAGTRMSVDALKRLWPVFVSPKVRDWFDEHLMSGTVERMVIAVNAPLDTLKASGPPIPDDGLSLDALATNCVIRPVQGLPALRDADLNVHIVGRDAEIALGKATADLPSGEKLVDVVRPVRSARYGAARAAGARALQARRPGPGRRRAVGHGPLARRCRRAVRSGDDPRHDERAGVAWHAAEARSAAGIDQLTHHGRCHEFFRRTHDHGAEGRRRGAAGERHNQGFQLKGDVKIGGTPASLEYRKARGDSDAEISMQGMLDDGGAQQSRPRSGEHDQRRRFRSGSSAASAPRPTVTAASPSRPI